MVFHRDYSVDDGRYNNNGWLQELPEPVTKMAWDNARPAQPQDLEELGLVNETKGGGTTQASLVKVVLEGREIVGPVWVQPGLADNSLGLALGYGRERSGRVGRGAGYDAYRLRTTAAAHCATGASLAPAGAAHPVATVQHHWSMEGRPAVREANLDQYYEHPRVRHGDEAGAAADGSPLYPNPFDEAKKNGLHQWGMSIDLNPCVGCSACMLACQSENNMPIVGKDQVGRGREMHWMRIDRYYAGSPEDPEVVLQPYVPALRGRAVRERLPRQRHLARPGGAERDDLQPLRRHPLLLEQLPVQGAALQFLRLQQAPDRPAQGAVLFDALDAQHGRRIGLAALAEEPGLQQRPEDEWDLIKMIKNPDVTVRMRGVMEKCTFCIQRIEQAKIAAKVKARDSGDVVVPDGTITTACQQACPAEAIVFGNLKDRKAACPSSRRSSAITRCWISW